MESISLVDLGPVIAAILGPMLGFVVVLMRYQHLDSVKTRELIERSSRETLEKAGEMIERSLGSLSPALAEHKRDTKENFREMNRILLEMNRSLADGRERLARIEGHLGIGVTPPGEPGNASDEAASRLQLGD